MNRINDFSLAIATVNGSGSMSANQILSKALFRMNLPVSAKNVFPSNISGLPTWYNIRVNPQGFLGRTVQFDIVVAKNPETAAKDLATVRPGGYFIFDRDMKFSPERSDVTIWPLPFREISEKVTETVKIRKLLTNTIYLGALAHLLKIDRTLLTKVIADQFEDKNTVVELNVKALDAGIEFAAKENWSWPFVTQALQAPSAAPGVAEVATAPQALFINGNSAAALGAVAGGCTFMSWYPITPSTSLAESFQHYCEQTRVDIKDNSKKFAVVQAEDELSAVNMMIGAGWAGARAMTATSGPGLSLMAEAAGLSYFAEIPAVIWCVQRAGPSTGLPTRTMQGDLEFASTLSHGDTEHVVLLPANVAECFEFAQTAFDLAERLQTLVIVLSDLDLGMNFHPCPELKLSASEYNRGKVLSAEDLNKVDDFARYRDVDGDGIGYRTLPGTLHAKAAYFTRGTGHTEKATYSEEGDNYAKGLLRLKKKFELNRKMMPSPVVKSTSGANIGLVYYGSSSQVIAEVQSLLKAQGHNTNTLGIRALPLSDEVGEFLDSQKQVFIIEQNRDAQMRNKLTTRFTNQAGKFSSALSYDGQPIAAEVIAQQILQQLRGQP